MTPHDFNQERMFDELAKSAAAFPQEAGPVEVKQTHISHVFLLKERVYKIKKEVRFPFVDYSTLEKRRQACVTELELNRRLAPTVYLDVLPIVQLEDGAFRVGSEDERETVVDYCVRMNRLPTDHMLDTLLLSDQATPSQRRELVDMLVAFHARAERSTTIDQFATGDAMRHHVQGNLDTLYEFRSPFTANSLDRIRSSQLQYVTFRRDLFDQRIAQRRICDGHGDLRPEHVCMTDPPAIYDCVEFSQEFRAGDVINEVAFLAMECDYLMVPEWGAALIPQYLERAKDPCPLSLGSFFKAYRACVRAKVELLRFAQEQQQDESRVEAATRYIQLASGYAADFHQPFLLVTVGISGSGKSVLTKVLSQQLGAEWIRTDAVRQELTGSRAPDADENAGIYSKENTQWTYREVLERAGSLLRDAVSVVIDGTFLDPQFRQQVRTLAAQIGVRVRFLYCQIPADLASSRVSLRREEGLDISDAPPALPASQHRTLEKAADLSQPDVCRLDMTGEPDEVREELIELLASQWHHED